MESLPSSPNSDPPQTKEEYLKILIQEVIANLIIKQAGREETTDGGW